MVTTDKTPEVTPLVTVRATVNLNGLRAGATALVDPNQPYIADCLKTGYLVLEPEGDE
jgi:hypothetical protein